MILHPRSVQRCTRCVLTADYPGLDFDEHGICSRCREFEPSAVHGDSKLHEAVERSRTPGGKYDCLVMLSGGRDSTFTLHYAVKELGLRVLACAIDNGCVPEETHENIRNATSILGVDLLVKTHDNLLRSFPAALSAWFRRPSPGLLPTLCTGCRRGLARCYREFSRKSGISLRLSGGGEPEKSIATSFFATSSDRETRARQLVLGLATEVARNPGYWTRTSLLVQMLLEYSDSWLAPQSLHRLRKTVTRARTVTIELFRFVPWNEKLIMDTITSKLKWKRYRLSRADWRSDCKIAVLRNYFNYQILGFSKHDELVSNLVRQGTLSRAEALSRVEHDNDQSEDSIREICGELGVRYDDRWRTRLPREWRSRREGSLGN